MGSVHLPHGPTVAGHGVSTGLPVLLYLDWGTHQDWEEEMITLNRQDINVPVRNVKLWDIPIGTTFTGTVLDRSERFTPPYTSHIIRGVFLRGTGYVAQLDPAEKHGQRHLGWSLSERDHMGVEHREISVLSYQPVNLKIDVSRA